MSNINNEVYINNNNIYITLSDNYNINNKVDNTLSDIIKKILNNNINNINIFITKLIDKLLLYINNNEIFDDTILSQNQYNIIRLHFYNYYIFSILKNIKKDINNIINNNKDNIDECTTNIISLIIKIVKSINNKIIIDIPKFINIINIEYKFPIINLLTNIEIQEIINECSTLNNILNKIISKTLLNYISYKQEYLYNNFNEIEKEINILSILSSININNYNDIKDNITLLEISIEDIKEKKTQEYLYINKMNKRIKRTNKSLNIKEDKLKAVQLKDKILKEKLLTDEILKEELLKEEILKEEILKENKKNKRIEHINRILNIAKENEEYKRKSAKTEDKTEEDKTEEDKIKEDKIKEDKIKGDKIKENKIKEDKIKEDKIKEYKLNINTILNNKIKYRSLNSNNISYINNCIHSEDCIIHEDCITHEEHSDIDIQQKIEENKNFSRIQNQLNNRTKLINKIIIKQNNEIPIVESTNETSKATNKTNKLNNLLINKRLNK